MRKIKISKACFYWICSLLLLLPILLKIPLLVYGVRTQATVVDQVWVHRVSLKPHSSIYSIVQFETKDRIISVYGPSNEKYEMGKQLEIIYDANQPSNYRILSVYHFYAGLEAGLAGFLLVVWAGLYRTFG